MKEENFNEYISYFKDQPLKEKQKIIIEQLQMLTSLTNMMCTQLGINNKVLMNRELIDIKKENYTEDDFAEAVIVYINSIQNSICDFDLKLTDLLKKLN